MTELYIRGMCKMDIKKIKQEIYRFNFINSELEDRYAILSVNEEGLDELLIALKKTDFDNGISVIPAGYTSGLYYSSKNDGEIYSSPYKIPDIVKFRLSFDGLRRNGWYRLKVISRDYGSNDDIATIADDRSLYVTTSNNELLVDEDLSNVEDNKEFISIFKSTSNEIDLIFKMGSIYISDIIVEEIIPDLKVEEEDEEFPHTIIGEGKYRLYGWGIYDLNMNVPQEHTSYTRITQLSGQGISLFYDSKNNEICLERDGTDSTMIDPFTDSKYVIELNENKITNYDKSKKENIYDKIVLTEINSDLSPNTRELGFVKYAFIKNGNKIKFSNSDSKLTIFIWKIV
jgi:hypothetical protein